MQNCVFSCWTCSCLTSLSNALFKDNGKQWCITDLFAGCASSTNWSGVTLRSLLSDVSHRTIRTGAATSTLQTKWFPFISRTKQQQTTQIWKREEAVFKGVCRRSQCFHKNSVLSTALIAWVSVTSTLCNSKTSKSSRFLVCLTFAPWSPTPPGWPVFPPTPCTQEESKEELWGNKSCLWFCKLSIMGKVKEESDQPQETKSNWYTSPQFNSLVLRNAWQFSLQTELSVVTFYGATTRRRGAEGYRQGVGTYTISITSGWTSFSDLTSWSLEKSEKGYCEQKLWHMLSRKEGTNDKRRKGKRKGGAWRRRKNKQAGSANVYQDGWSSNWQGQRKWLSLSLRLTKNFLSFVKKKKKKKHL